MKNLILTVAVGSALFFASGTSHAAIVVDYSGSDIDMGTVAIGQTGTIDVDTFGGLIINRIQGVLPTNSIMTLSYNFGGNVLSGILASGAEYSYTDGGVDYYGNAIAVEPGSSVSYGTVNGAVSSSLVLASSQVDFANNSAQAIITNNASDFADFASVFAGIMIGSDVAEVAYSVSAVPIPAALPLFGAGLGALAGFGAWRKRKEEAA